jgi:phage baseplate assembly protein W
VGERVMRPTFGWRRDMLIFEPMTAAFATFLRQEIEKAVLFHEPRVIVNRVTFETLADEDGRITLALDYTVRATNTRNNLVYPFYLAEATNA